MDFSRGAWYTNAEKSVPIAVLEWMNLELKAFELIETGLEEELVKQGFAQAQPLEDPAGRAVMFVAADVAYSLLYDGKRQRFELRSTTLQEGKPGNWRSLSLWLFDEKEGTREDAESILSDFLEVVQGPKRVAVVQQRRRGKDGERVVDPLFFVNRLVNIFPELRSPLNEEKTVYGQVRYATFLKGKVAPLCDDLMSRFPDSDPAKKLCALFEDMYANGDLDTRSLTTITLLNALSDGAFAAVQERAGDDLKKDLKFTRRLKGKKIKPEKKKKQKKVVAKPLDNSH